MTKTTALIPPLVCVIDDNDIVREMICRALQCAGFATVDACDGKEGLRVAKMSAPSVVVTDMVMARCDGVEAIMELKRTAPSVRILAISGGGTCGGRDLFDLARCAGADACLSKPFKVKDLVDKVTMLALAA